MAKAKIGDVLEIATPKGFAYAQYTHKHQLMGDLIRVLPGIFHDRPDDIDALLEEEPQFVTFVPLASFMKRKTCSTVANRPIPASQQEFPLFRNGLPNPSTQKVENWWLWDGVQEWKVGQLSKEQRKLPIMEVWNDTLLIERIVAKWRPENDPSLN